MKTIFGTGRIKEKFLNPVVAIGVFDGVHRGHQYLIKKMVRRAKALKGTSIVVTFFPHPAHVLNPKISLPFIVSLAHRLKLIEALGVDVCLVIHFTKRFSQVSAGQFLTGHLLRLISPREVFIGSNFRFGKNRTGDIRLLKKFGQRHGFKTNSILPVKKNGQVVSSTRLRHLIAAGKINLAGQMLGRPFSILDTVQKGDGRGKLLGFPTANINPARQSSLPPRGVYLAQVVLENEKFNAMVNIGLRPSFKRKNNEVTIEAYIFDFRRNIYGRDIEIKFLRYIRPERKFPSKEKLINQLIKDEKKARKIFSTLK